MLLNILKQEKYVIAIQNYIRVCCYNIKKLHMLKTISEKV